MYNYIIFYGGDLNLFITEILSPIGENKKYISPNVWLFAVAGIGGFKKWSAAEC